jgi:hypothetical protein
MTQKTSLFAVVPSRTNWFGFSSCCLLVTTYLQCYYGRYTLTKERSYGNLTAVLEGKCNNCIFLSRTVILRHRIGWEKLRNTQTGKTRRTMISSKTTSYEYPKKQLFVKPMEYKWIPGVKWIWLRSKKKQLGNSDFFLLHQDHMTCNCLR